VDCSLAELSGRRDAEWVTVGGMIAQAKRIRTKKGDPMMFATLDDLEGSVELVIFGKALDACGEAIATDSIVLVRGRVDHKDRERTCLVVQQIDSFQPSAEEVAEAEQAAAKAALPPTPLRLRLDAAALPASALRDLKELLVGYPGEAEVVIELLTSAGPRQLRLGTDFRVAQTAGLHAELDSLLGEAVVGEERSERLAATA
jgi:DNA polymerase-3 subunit alpha